jgi:hypothetical protein
VGFYFSIILSIWGYIRSILIIGHDFWIITIVSGFVTMNHDYHHDAFDWKHGRPRPRRHHHDHIIYHHSDCKHDALSVQKNMQASNSQINLCWDHG